MWVRNGTDERREVTVKLAERADADPWFARSYGFDIGAQLAVELRTPREETVEVPKSWFDCNDSAMEAVLHEEEVEKTGVTTDMGCSAF